MATWENPDFKNFDFGDDPELVVPDKRKNPKRDEIPPEQLATKKPRKYTRREQNAAVSLTKEKIADLFRRIDPYLDAEHRQYTKDILAGKGRVDIIYELEFLLRNASLLFLSAMQPQLDNGYVTEQIATMGNLIRQTAKDLHSIHEARMNREERAAALNGEGKMSFITKEQEFEEWEKEFEETLK